MKPVSRRLPRALLLNAALVATFSQAATAAEIALELNPAQTHVAWTLGDVLHTVHGTFKLTRGTIRFDPATGQASGEMIVDAASGESGSSARDGRMHKNILESAKYPAITFKPDRIEGAVNLEGDSQVQLHGSFGIHGAEHELTVPAKVHFSNSQMSAPIDFLVPYVKWGMKNPSTLFLKVKDTVDIEVQASGSQIRQ
jgi:polyisoprenoid-binding protein YceI